MRDDRERFFPGEPAFEMLYRPEKSRLASADELVQAMDEGGVDKSVVFGFPWADIEKSRAHNDYVIESVNRFPDRLIGFCCLDPLSSGADLEVERCFNAGLAGVGELAFYTGGIDTAAINGLSSIMKICREKNVPIMIHTNEPVGHEYPGKTPVTPGQILDLAKTYPENKIILAHWGGGIFFYHLMKKEVKDILANLWFDTAASPYLYDARIYSIALEIIGSEKILFGSDYPLLQPARYYRDIDESGVDKAAKGAILGGSAEKLLFGKTGFNG